MQELELLIKVAIAAGLGGIIGIEREIAHKPAGMRTHMLVAGLAALIMIVGEYFIGHVQSDIIRRSGADPTRIIHAVIMGISILGAGTIIRSAGGNHVEGLTTAASILFAGGVGIAVAVNMYIMAIGATILALIILIVFKIVETSLGKENTET